MTSERIKNLISPLNEIWTNVDKQLFYFSIISLEISAITFLRIHFFVRDINVVSSLEIILTVNGLFSAILVTYFFNRVSRTLDNKKEDADEAVEYSQKITDFRRICKILTDYYNIWRDEKATKNLLENGKFKNVDYFDYKLSSYSDYVPIDKDIIEEMYSHKDYREGPSDLFLGLISLVENRKANFYTFDHQLYKDFQRKGIYQYQFISNCVEIDYASRLWYWFSKNVDYIQYENLGKTQRDEILSALQRIDKKFINAELNNSTMADLCDDMNEFYFKELLILLNNLKQGLSSFNLLIFSILISCLTLGVFFPMLVYFLINDSALKTVLAQILISLNIGLLLFFIIALYRIVEKEITWT